MVDIEKFVVGPLETNCYLVYSKSSKIGFLIDPGIFDKNILNKIKEKGIQIENIINTHGHPDHTGGDREFGYPVLIHKSDSAFLENPVKNLAKLLKDGDIIEKGDIKFEVIHTPGHTPGGISLKLSTKGGNRIFTGDTLFCEGIGRADLPYSNEMDLLNSIRKRLMVFPDDTEILPGHGPNSTIGFERRNNPFLSWPI